MCVCVCVCAAFNPCSSKNALCVGAMDSRNDRDDGALDHTRVSYFSSQGPTRSASQQSVTQSVSQSVSDPVSQRTSMISHAISLLHLF
jgi:hypothetical protein